MNSLDANFTIGWSKAAEIGEDITEIGFNGDEGIDTGEAEEFMAVEGLDTGLGIKWTGDTAFLSNFYIFGSFCFLTLAFLF